MAIFGIDIRSISGVCDPLVCLNGPDDPQGRILLAHLRQLLKLTLLRDLGEAAGLHDRFPPKRVAFWWKGIPRLFQGNPGW